MTPFGARVTHQEAAQLASRSLSTIYRWVQHGHVRADYRWDADEGHSILYLSQTDVLSMRDRKWTRRPRTTR